MADDDYSGPEVKTCPICTPEMRRVRAWVDAAKRNRYIPIMSKPHSNLFAYYGDFNEAYKAFLAEQERDERSCNFYTVIGIAAVVLASTFPKIAPIVLAFGVPALMASLTAFIDMSNRNSMLHLIDFLRWQNQDPKR